MKKKDIQENFLVQKSRPLFSLWESGFNLTQFKILDIYLSKINSHDPLNRTVVFDRQELCEIFGVSQIRTEDLKKHMKELQETSVYISDNDEIIDLVTLFSRSRAELDEYGVSKLELTCTAEAMQYFFNVEHFGYFKYKINAITHITSLYSYLMFLYIEYNRFKKTWEVSVDDLKRFLNCEKVESCKEFKIFNRDILKKVQKELADKVNCIFEYKTVKRGRTVTHIQFTVMPMIEDNVVYTDNDQLNILETEIPRVIDRIAMACEYKFNSGIETIYNLISTSCIPNYIKGDTEEDKQYYFVYQTYKKMVAYEETLNAKKKKIRNRFEYFYKMLETEIKKAVKQAEQEQGQTIKEQSYDINEFKKFSVTFSGNTKNKAEEPTEEPKKIPDAEPKEKAAEIVSEEKKITDEEIKAFFDNFGKIIE